MSEPENSEEGFKLVTGKRSKKAPQLLNKLSCAPTEYNKDLVQRCCNRVEDAKREIESSDFYKSVLASLREGLAALGKPIVQEIVCFGLGKISECFISKYQFALFLCLKELYRADVKLFDPVFTVNDRSIIEYFDCLSIDENLEGKYKIKDKATTIFYLPHCPKQLANNLLWANWGLNLNYCIIICNSFNSICEKTPIRLLEKNAQFICTIESYVTELAIINDFKYFEIFNDTAIHIFPYDKIKLLSADFWTYLTEPKYAEDVEFITK